LKSNRHVGRERPEAVSRHENADIPSRNSQVVSADQNFCGVQALFYAKLYLRILRPNWAALLPQDNHSPRSLRAAFDVLDREIQKLHEEAALAA
jgi:hypothetical protein